MADVLCWWRCASVVAVFVFNCFLLDLTSAASVSSPHPAREFRKHTLVVPRLYHGRHKRQISTTKEESGEHSHHLRLDYELNGENHILDLRLNRDLIPGSYFTRVQHHGKHRVIRPAASEVELCHYQGTLRGRPGSWAALSTCHGLHGVVHDGSETYYVHHAQTHSDPGPAGGAEARLDDEHYFYAHADLLPEAASNMTCGHQSGPLHGEHERTYHGAEEFHRVLRSKRSATVSEPTVRGPYNANKQSRFVELVLVVDNREYKEFGESIPRVEKHCKDIANIINALYAPLNIFIALVGVDIWTDNDEIQFFEDGDKTLTNFLHYRREKLIKEHPNDNAQLLTKFIFMNGVVGKALKGPICTYEFSGGVNHDHSPVIGLVATTVAHEMGHNFGMEHDTNECECPDDRCIMAPSSSTQAPRHWSKCSLDYLAMAFEHGMDYCLRNKPAALFGSPVCGNGFVEPGEQCDCGLPHQCANTCCNATTCMLHRNASCATGECCNFETCKPKTAGTLCRSADYECDLPEYCTGQSEYCPRDIYKQDTVPCENGRAYCYQGCCRTRSDQCKLLWGNTGKSSDDQCYKMNTKGSRHGNCGYDRLNKTFLKCVDENVLCGMLHCKHLNERLEFGMESVSVLSHSFINLKGSVIPCRTAVIDLGLNEIDPGLSPDGARCGDGKMCVNQRCMAVDSLRLGMGSCDCNGHGVCNSMGHCHCDDGFAPPYCDYPGVGGSDDSGPARDPNANQLMKNIIISLLVIVLLIGLVTAAIYSRRFILMGSLKKSPAVAKSPSKQRGPGPGAFSVSDATSPKRGALNTSTEDNHSLLADQTTPDTTSPPSEFYGHFKGFSLTPIKAPEAERQSQQPIRHAPPVPRPPPAATPNATGKGPNKLLAVKPIIRAASFKSTTAAANGTLPNGIAVVHDVSTAPALPPPNALMTSQQHHHRPVISSPILEASTCTARELESPLRHAAPKMPIRPAPEAPITVTNNNNKKSKHVTVSDEVLINPVFVEPVTINKKLKENKTLNRIASFLKKGSGSSSNSQVPAKAVTSSSGVTAGITSTVATVQESRKLRTLEISSPVPVQTHVDIAISVVPLVDEPDASKAAVVMRAQSMRGTQPAMRPKIATFGSMRNPNGRPISIPSGARPKSPPPPRPGQDRLPPTLHESGPYDDCLNAVAAPLAHFSSSDDDTSFASPTSMTDNIYAVIEEPPAHPQHNHHPPALSKTAKAPPLNSSTSSGESTSGGSLLGEIVSEIQNRNLDSIYSTSTIGRRPPDAASADSAVGANEYANADSSNRVSGNEYSNMSSGTAPKSSASSTVSSAYVSPNPPVLLKAAQSGAVTATTNPTSSSSSNKTDHTNSKQAMSTFKGGSGDTTTTSSKNQSNNSSNSNQTNANNGKMPFRRQNSNDSTGSSASGSATSSKPTAKVFSRQITPPSLRTRNASPVRSAPSAPNSTKKPGAAKTSSKLPDVVATTTKPTNKVKPNLPARNGTVKTDGAKTTGTAAKLTEKRSVKPPIAAKTDLPVASKTSTQKSTISALKPTKSNVASLQQRFENKDNTTVK